MKKKYYERIKEKSKEDPVTGCWNWTGKSMHRQGYAFARHGNAMRTVIRGLAIELNLFPDINFNSRITNSCANRLCVNPDHIICLTHTEINYRRYNRHGTQGQFTDNDAKRIEDEYEGLEGTEGRVKMLAKQYDCSMSVIYRTLERARHFI
jgi:hypothetical protein